MLSLRLCSSSNEELRRLSSPAVTCLGAISIQKEETHRDTSKSLLGLGILEIRHGESLRVEIKRFGGIRASRRRAWVKYCL